MILTNRTKRMLYCQYKFVRPGECHTIQPAEVIYVTDFRKQNRIWSDLLGDFNVGHLIVVDTVDGEIRGDGINKKYGSHNDYGVAFIDLTNKFMAAGNPVTKVYHPGLMDDLILRH